MGAKRADFFPVGGRNLALRERLKLCMLKLLCHLIILESRTQGSYVEGLGFFCSAKGLYKTEESTVSILVSKLDLFLIHRYFLALIYHPVCDFLNSLPESGPPSFLYILFCLLILFLIAQLIHGMSVDFPVVVLNGKKTFITSQCSPGMTLPCPRPIMHDNPPTNIILSLLCEVAILGKTEPLIGTSLCASSCKKEVVTFRSIIPFSFQWQECA